MDQQEFLIEEILKHLDAESQRGVGRMSVSIDEKQTEQKQVDHKCCHMYGRPSTHTVNLLDMYSDSSMDS